MSNQELHVTVTDVTQLPVTKDDGEGLDEAYLQQWYRQLPPLEKRLFEMGQARQWEASPPIRGASLKGALR